MKKNMFARIACAMLAILMLATTAIACGKTEDPAATTANGDATTVAGGEGDTPAQTEAPTHDANGFLLDDLDPSLN